MFLGVQYVRAGEIFEVRDEDDVVLNDFSRWVDAHCCNFSNVTFLLWCSPDERKGGRLGSKRKLRLRLDPAQYYEDVKNSVDCYEQLNLLVRRKSKENNFKAVLETIRDLMTSAAVGKAIPSWLHDVFLGYGSPHSAHYRNMPSALALPTSGDEEEAADYTDTFLDCAHVIEAFPDADVSFTDDSGVAIKINMKNPETHPSPPFKLYIKRAAEGGKDKIRAVPHSPVNMGPFLQDGRPRNTVRYITSPVA